MKWLRAPAESGNVEAQLKLADCYYEGNGVKKDYVEAVKWLKGPAESGNIEAQLKLADCYYEGNGVERYYVEAVKWLKNPAESGNVEAQFKLGDCYYNGNGVKKDCNEAVKWLKNPAESGNADAQCMLGNCYFSGDGVKKDFNEALKWWGRSAALGNAEAKEKMERNGNPFRNAKVGDFVKFGRYPQESGNESQPVEWQVLSRENGQMLVISRYGLDAKRFDGSSNNWEKSEIRKWLNGEFYNGSFAAEEKARIKSFNQDNVFLLSREEAEKYFANSDARKCRPTSYAKANGAGVNNGGYCWWWLRSADPYDSNFVCYVSYGGDFYYDVFSSSGSVRPALWINLES